MLPFLLLKSKRQAKYTYSKIHEYYHTEEIERDWVYRPRYSNSFLLHNSKSTFELFNIRSEADYRLVYELRRIQDNLKVQDNAKELFVKIDDSISVYNDDSYIRVYDSGKEKIRKPKEDFIRSPSIVFEYIKKCIVNRVNLF